MRALLSLIFLIVFSQAYCQQCVVASALENIIYLGLPNQIDIAVEGRYCKDLIITTDNGKLQKSDGCTYFITPEKEGKTVISISEKRGKHKILGASVFRAKSIPLPEATIAGKSGGELSKRLLEMQIGPVAKFTYLGICANPKITAYTVIIMRESKAIFVEDCNEIKFSYGIWQAFAKTQTNDEIIITNILCKYPNDSIFSLQPIAFKISE